MEAEQKEQKKEKSVKTMMKKIAFKGPSYDEYMKVFSKALPGSVSPTMVLSFISAVILFFVLYKSMNLIKDKKLFKALLVFSAFYVTFFQ
ncbi:putative exported protein [Plasmodium gaboni]|uniref:Putative exported protein n=1 Tax=Plasmodium gaboni TaxID=647221 RepID=A0A151L397_9APIC|nr:putative exported protein [Plasmodium gaboni]KYN93438.1 putative exported protein [Plasmodium gaboni]